MWRRKFPRLRKDFHISYRVIDRNQFHNDPVSSLAVNISGGGICFETTEPFPKETLLAVEIQTNDDRPSILALVQVMWCKASGGGYQIGAEFWWVGWHDNMMQNYIANYVAAHTTATPASA